MNRRSFVSYLGSLAAFIGWARPSSAMPAKEIPDPRVVCDLKSMNEWIDSWPCIRHESMCAIEKTASGRTIEHIELAWGAAFGLDELDVSRFTYGEYGFLSDETKEYIRSSTAYQHVLPSLYGYAARSIYGHAMGAEGADVYWRIKPEDDVSLGYKMTEISPDGPDYDWAADSWGKKVLTHGLIKFYCRFSFDTDRYAIINESHEVDMADLPRISLYAGGSPIQISPRS